MLLLIAAPLSRSAGSDETAATQLVRVPDPLQGENPLYELTPRRIPEPGDAFRDSSFGSRLMRVTRQPGLRHEYARFDPFNLDQSMIVLVWPPAGDYRIYRTRSVPYDSPLNLVATLDLEEPRWDRQDPNVIWGLRDFRILIRDVSSGKTTVIKDFARDPVIGP